MTAPDPVTAYLTEVRERAGAATPGPWWSDQSDLTYRLHGVAFKIPVQLGGMLAEQVMNKQIAKAPKSGTSYAEYWPDAADDAFITSARTDVPRLLAAVEAALGFHKPQSTSNGIAVCPRCSREAGEMVKSPCPEVAVISAALLGEDAGHDRAST